MKHNNKTKYLQQTFIKKNLIVKTKETLTPKKSSQDNRGFKIEEAFNMQYLPKDITGLA